VSPVGAGSQVKKDELLGSFSAPNVTMTVQTFILNLGAEERFQDSANQGLAEGQALGAASANVTQRIQQLQAVGMSLRQIDEIRRTHRVPERIKIFSPVDGFVLARNVSPGQKFDKGADWFVIADLSKVWILADVADRDLTYLRPGMSVQMSVSGQDKRLPARITAILPQIDPVTRTAQVRLEADNPGYRLRPEMFVDVEVPVKLAPGITVPVDALIDSGLKKTVFVERGTGIFEPRDVQTGSRFDGRVQITKGLREGERIVTSGTFLIDSDSKLRGAPMGLVAAQSSRAVDPSCGMEVDIEIAHASSHEREYRGKRYYFCSDECMRKFDAAPARFVKNTAEPDRPGA
jgi:membrane fusion protein, copper/silver efflux system